MTRYLISFPTGAMDHTHEEFPAVGEAAHAVVQEAMDAGGRGVGREARDRLPLCSRDPRVHARPSGGQLIETPDRPFMPKAPDQTIA